MRRGRAGATGGLCGTTPCRRRSKRSSGGVSRTHKTSVLQRLNGLNSNSHTGMEQEPSLSPFAQPAALAETAEITPAPKTRSGLVLDTQASQEARV